MATKKREVPYYTTDDESKWCGHIWRQRQFIGGPWGFAWEVLPPHGGETPDAIGWDQDQETAELRMNRVLKSKKE